MGSLGAGEKWRDGVVEYWIDGVGEKVFGDRW